jgi:hypothetical protein
MSKQGSIPLKERAVHAWQEERPKRTAQLLKRINLTFELRQKLERLFGHDLPIKVVTDLQDRPIAMIDDLRFTLTTHGKKNQKNLILMDTCPRCWAETGVPINTLANLGQLLERFGTTLNLGCSECIGLTDNELKPSDWATVQRQK